ncbi:hypothetical protein KJ966_26380 [bacterium]|nr:hypothetical protein [bacterium]
MPKDSTPIEMDLQQPVPEKRIETAFIQVPVEIKDQVESYISSLMKSSDLDLKKSDGNINDLPSQGCFLVISLDKVEKIIKNLRNCLSMESDNETADIKAEIRRTLTLLS